MTALVDGAVPAHPETGSNYKHACLTPAKAKSMVGQHWKGNRKSVLEGRVESQIISRADEKPEQSIHMAHLGRVVKKNPNHRPEFV